MFDNRLVTSTRDEEESTDNINQELERYLSEDVLNRKKTVL